MPCNPTVSFVWRDPDSTDSMSYTACRSTWSIEVSNGGNEASRVRVSTTLLGPLTAIDKATDLMLGDQEIDSLPASGESRTVNVPVDMSAFPPGWFTIKVLCAPVGGVRGEASEYVQSIFVVG